jgi:NAD-dependent SIR2 family protein deacetylase
VADDLAQCKHCKFYCNYSSMKKALSSPEVEKLCPMCEVQITLDDIVFVGENGVAGLKKAPPPKEEGKEKK